MSKAVRLSVRFVEACRPKLCGDFDKIIQFADSFLRCESEVFECEREIDSKLSCARGRRAGRWIKEIIFCSVSHAAVSISLAGDGGIANILSQALPHTWTQSVPPAVAGGSMMGMRCSC